MARAARELALAAGLRRDGRSHRRAVLRPIGADETRDLLEREADALPAERTTALLATAVVALGDLSPVTEEDIRELPVGDRDRLVLTLRSLLHGDALTCVFSCAHEGCGETLELELDVATLLGGEPAAAPREAAATTADQVRVRVRAATGRDHERAAQRALSDQQAAARELLAACVIDARGPSGAAVDLDDEVAACADTLLAQLDPGAELLLEGDCAACGEPVAATFDATAHLWVELEQRRALLEHEVHRLALHYHWSEREIVALAPARRARYLAQLDRHLAAR